MNAKIGARIVAQVWGFTMPVPVTALIVMRCICTAQPPRLTLCPLCEGERKVLTLYGERVA